MNANEQFDRIVQDEGSRNGYKPARPATPTHDELRDRWIEGHPEIAYGMGEWKRYAGSVYRKEDEDEVRRAVSQIIDAAKAEGVRPTSSVINSVFEMARINVAVPSDLWDADPDILVCQNGVLRIPSGELHEHRRENYATSAVPYDYDPEAKAQMWQLFLASTAPEAQEFLQEFAGYALTTDTMHELALWLYGPPGSGKSTFVEGLRTMLGERAGILGLADLERSRFALANLPGKTLVTATEQPSGYVSTTETLNAIISGESITVEQKYRNSYDLIPRAKIAWAMNELPRVSDASSGIFRRVKVVEFPPIAPESRDPAVKEGIRNEGAGILNWALEGLYRLRERGYFEIPEAVEQATAHFRETNDIPALFLEDCCVRDDAERVQAGKLYAEYKDWCLENGHKPKSSTTMANEWQRLGFEKRRPGGVSHYYGLRLLLPGERGNDGP
jgi:putative DNA primase/helicase